MHKQRIQQKNSNDHFFDNNEEIISFLKESRHFSQWPDALIRRLVPISKFSDFPAGMEILKESQFNDRVYFLARGQVRILVEGEHILDLKRRGDIFGEMSVISQKPCSATVVAKEDAQVFSIRARDITTNNGTKVDEMGHTLNRLFAAILTDKLFATTRKAQQYELGKRQLTHEIKERELSEERVKTALLEKEILVQEIHHRVRNNLSIVSGLLELQANTIDSMKTRKTLEVYQGRIQAMCLVHDLLIESDDMTNLNLKDFIPRLVKMIEYRFPETSNRIKIKLEMPDYCLSLEEAIPVGLIVNELVINSLKHAFGENCSGDICIKFIEKEKRLIVSDNGIGLPDQLNWNSPISLGLQLVKLLCEKQLHANISFKRDKGTRISIVLNK